MIAVEGGSSGLSLGLASQRAAGCRAQGGRAVGTWPRRVRGQAAVRSGPGTQERFGVTGRGWSVSLWEGHWAGGDRPLSGGQ